MIPRVTYTTPDGIVVEVSTGDAGHHLAVDGVYRSIRAARPAYKIWFTDTEIADAVAEVRECDKAVIDRFGMLDDEAYEPHREEICDIIEGIAAKWRRRHHA